MKIKYIIPIFLFIAVVINSCDKVSPPYVEKSDLCDGIKKVLLEDYTGHGCVNCPQAAVEAHTINEELCETEKKLVIIGVHAGYFATPNFDEANYGTLFSADFTTEAGNTWDTFFGNSAMGNPNGLVDRVKTSNSYVLYKESWRNVAAERLSEPAKAIIIINNDFDTDSKELTTIINTEFLSNVTGNHMLIVCVTQNNIIAPQKNLDELIGPTPIDSVYVHNHVLRGSLNGAWGENISASGTIDVGSEYEKTYVHTFPTDWIPKDCHVVAFVYNEESKEVLQVEEAAVLE